jgi:amino acid adenylation domain-containing protein
MSLSFPMVEEPRASEPDVQVYAMPATQGQIRFWSLDQLNPGNPALNMPLMWQCTGELNVPRLMQAFSACVARHEMLRTTFEVVDGQLTQVIGPAFEVAMPLVDLSHLPDAAHTPEARRLIREHAAIPMDLRHGPLLRLKLLRYTPQHHLLLVTMHHIICDGISLGILLRDAAAFYESLAERSEPALPALPIQFGDYAVWAEEWRNGPEAEASREFWRKTLGNDCERINLHRDRKPVASGHDPGEGTGDIETLLIPPELAAAAHRFCIRENVTFNILLSGVFAALMSRLTGQLDLVIGSPCGNRTEETEELIGLFMNIQVMRIRLERESTFRDLLERVRSWSLGAYENQALPFEDLIHDSFFGTNSNAFQIPVFFLYQKSFMLTQRVAGLEIVPLRSESPGAIFELMFAIVDRAEEGPRLQLEYNPQLFEVETIRRILRMYVGLLESAIAAPAKRVDQLRVLSVAEREEIVHSWNRTEIDFGPFHSLPEILAERALHSPAKTAVQCAGVSWTFAELHRYAARLARILIRDGLKPGDLVGVCVERSCEMLGAVHAVLMAGGAYVPLDPRYPAERLNHVIEDAGMRSIVHGKTRPAAIGETIHCIDLHAVSTNDDLSAIPLPTLPEQASLAYVIYTSGSTGRPKGVAIEHGSLMNLLHAMERELNVTDSDTFVAITTLAFDIAGLELFLPLLTGARLVIATDEVVHDGQQLVALLEGERATVLQATPGAWRMALDAGWTGHLPLKVLCGGEAMPRDLADQLLTRSDEVWNVYGPTETTIWSSATRVVPGNGPLSLGPPLANQQFYILDQHLQPVPIGIAGELYIGGAGVARGYWNQPALTAEKFLSNPFAPGRIYRTGDLARWTPEGLLTLLGRSDFQVKVRGYRIEPEEIEAILNSHPAVRESVVVAHPASAEHGHAGARLIAFVASGSAAHAGGEPSLNAELTALLKTRLPDYLCPDILCVLDALPRTPNGKIDRKHLPEVFAQAGGEGLPTGLAEAREFTPPRDVIERQLVQIWQSTLGIARISTRASFFSLGVGSLAALRLINRMNRIFALDLGLASLISASTIESVAELVRTRFAPNTERSVVPMHPQGSLPPLFLVHGVGGNIVNLYGLAMRLGRDRPVFGIQAQSLEQGRSALLRLEDMAAHYLREVRSIQPHGPYRLLGYSFGGTVALEMAHQLRAAGEDVALLGMLDAKSRAYEDTLAHATPVQAKVGHRLVRFHGNTRQLSLRERIRYVWGKLVTRSIRYSVRLAAALRLRRVPHFMKSAEDINFIALRNYKPRPFDGRLVLFRAAEQTDRNAPPDLGWNALFTQGVQVVQVPGDHERIFLEPAIEDLARAIRESLQPHAVRATHTGSAA